MFHHLIGIHDELSERLAALQALGRDTIPKRLAVTGERWRISQLMGAHTKLVDDEVYPRLVRTLSNGDRLLIERFRKDGLTTRYRLKQHLDEWGSERVFAEWHAYVAVLPAVVQLASQRIRDERYILYPLLRPLDGPAIAASAHDGTSAPRPPRSRVMALRFHKMHGLGNDFVVIDAREAAVSLDTARVRALADRRTGIGCDQLILIHPDDERDDIVSMQIWNSDGSEVEACGNASRCVPVLLGRDCKIRTRGGLLEASLSGSGATVDMGQPAFEWHVVPLAHAMDTLRLPLAWEELESPAAVNVGNPHLVFFVTDPYRIDLERLGPIIETDPVFPNRINVNVAQAVARDHVVMRTWERGAGLTRACGTGACATFAAGRRLGLLDAAVRLDLPGGTLHLAEGAGGHLLMSGPATHVFTGETDL